MSFNPNQFREVIRCTLKECDERILSHSAVELLMMTAAQETHLGTYLYQDDGDVEIENHLAAGIFQIESITFYDILERIVIPSYPGFKQCKFVDLITDIKLSILIARFKYWSVPEKLPEPDDISGLALYYKKYYNTYKGKAQISEVIINYERFCR